MNSRIPGNAFWRVTIQMPLHVWGLSSIPCQSRNGCCNSAHHWCCILSLTPCGFQVPTATYAHQVRLRASCVQQRESKSQVFVLLPPIGLSSRCLLSCEFACGIIMSGVAAPSCTTITVLKLFQSHRLGPEEGVKLAPTTSTTSCQSLHYLVNTCSSASFAGLLCHGYQS